VFNFDSPVDIAKLHPNSPPLNVICVGSAKDEQTAKQTVLGGKESGVFTYNFSEQIRKKPSLTFNDLNDFMKKQIKKYQVCKIVFYLWYF
jgi:hypothetical protein